MSQAILKSLGEVVGTATDWYLSFDKNNNTHAGIAIREDDKGAYNVYVTHADHQHQLLAKAVRVTEGWHTSFADLINPQWLVMPERSQGFGEARYTRAEAEQAFIDYAKAHHAFEKVTFIKTGAPGRTVVRRSVIVDDRTLGAVPFGVILDDRVIKGERIFAQDKDDYFYGIDIYG